MGVLALSKRFPLPFEENNVFIFKNSGHVLLESDNETV